MKISVGKPTDHSSQDLPSPVEEALRSLQTDEFLTEESLTEALHAFNISDRRLDSYMAIADSQLGNDIIADGSEIVRIVVDGIIRRLAHPVYPAEKLYLT